jgi:ribosomal protein S21
LHACKRREMYESFEEKEYQKEEEAFGKNWSLA